jgi:D-serine deaminase-like pyridoxal phosphate-dependent protein
VSIPEAPARAGDALAEVDTPALLLDLDRFERNLHAVHERVATAGLALRAHGKAHKCPAIGRLQIAAGAIGLCCQKVGEAEAFVAAGIGDVLVSNVIVGASKALRLARLADRARVSVCVDSALQVEQIGSAARSTGTTVGVLIEVDAGGGRCGVVDEVETLELAALIDAHRPWLEFRGLQAYNGRAQHMRTPQARRQAIDATAACAARHRDALRARGFACEVVTGGGTGSLVNELESGVFTEVQPGSYVLMDTDYAANEPDPRAPALGQALSVLSSVLTVRAGHAVLDGGLKAFSVDSGLPTVLLDGWRVRGLSDEHAVIVPEPDAVGARAVLAVGDKCQLIPAHCDPTVNLHDWIVAHRDGRVEAVWPIDARGHVF